MSAITILVDSREQRPFEFSEQGASVVRATLQTGDYSLPGLEHCCALERKSLDDLVGCLIGDNRARFERELVRGKGLDLFCVLIEATVADVREHRYRSQMNPESVLQSLLAFQARYGTSFIWAENRRCAEYMAYGLLRHFAGTIEARYKELTKAASAA